MSSNNFRDFLLALDSPRIVDARGKDPFEYAKPIIASAKAKSLIDTWQTLYREPFKGTTANGQVEPGLFQLTNEGFDARNAVAAAQALLASLNAGERKALQYPVDAPQWRDWYNPEFPMNANGVRLDYLSSASRDAVMNVLRASLSAEGYLKTEQCRIANLFLGELYDLRNIMNEWSYHFLLFGTPSLTEPWGWNLYGHHLALNCLMIGGQMIVSPTFMGAEPTHIDRGPHGAFSLFQNEESFGLQLMRSLSPTLRERATTYKQMKDPSMPEDRWHFADERQLGAAYRDNRVIPYEGVCAALFSSGQQEQLLKIVDAFIEYLPEGPREMRLRQVESMLERTYFSWIGGHGDDDPFYYRVHSPLIMVEFDHHSGVWLNNPTPEKFHIHTVVRTPNGNDYGKDLLRQHYLKEHRHGSPHMAKRGGAHDHSHDHPQDHDHSHPHGHDHSH
ncbi:DUF3500 domain-containing protein [Pseudomonas sp. 14P_8.1_Bac3]|uniref:DUF3500 domain-containing protein n=1 Tax=Pseudomonas sp. 14P_8.1_Bac3 TaxID=2971621 RepID=UPI0021C939B9|nr:DUF3500 domain-containing protein [Pseudomonas sp. 14P_8.1_Bac3]MCU1760905.1 DUF3500 domain-containing protein [Pseudomonas sp. 14P_8.1_Bac3]